MKPVSGTPDQNQRRQKKEKIKFQIDYFQLFFCELNFSDRAKKGSAIQALAMDKSKILSIDAAEDGHDR